MNETDEKVIDMRVILWEIIRHWKLLFVAAIIGAVLLIIFTFCQNIHSEEKTEEMSEETFTKNMEQPDIDEVSLAYQAYQKTIEEENYLENSIYMNIDSHSEHVGYLTYRISNCNNQKQMIDFYRSYIENGNLCTDIMDKQDLVSSISFLEELIAYVIPYTSNDKDLGITASGVFSVKILGKTEKQVNTLMALVTDALMSCHENVQLSMGTHSLTKISQNVLVISDEDTTKKQYTFRQQFCYFQDFYSRLRDALDEPQITLLDFRIAQSEGRDTTTGESLSSASISKYVILGILIGIFGMCAAICLSSILTDRIITERQVEDLNLCRIFGTYGSKKGSRLEKFILGDPGDDSEDQLKRICTNIQLYMQKEGLDTLFLVEENLSSTVTEKARLLSAQLSQSGLSCKNVINILSDAHQLEMLGNAKNVLLFTELGTITTSSFKKLTQQLQALDSTMIGTVFLQ